MPTDNLTLFLIGGAIGLISAVVGAVFDYFVNQQRSLYAENGLPGCMFIVAGSLGLAGVVATAVSLLLTHSVQTAVVIGLGVLTGFFIGFATLFVVTVLWSSKDK